MTQQTTTGVDQRPGSEQVPAYTPAAGELADLELLIAGAYHPLAGFLGEADTVAVELGGTLADGTPWPVPITLSVPDELAEASELELQDPEGVPIAVLTVRERWQRDGTWHLAGPVQRLTKPQYGAFRQLRRDPADVARELSGEPVLAVVADRPLLRPAIAGIHRVAAHLGARVLVLVRLRTGGSDSLVRAVLAMSDELPEGTVIVPVPLTRHCGDYRPSGATTRDELLRAHVAAAYGATHLLARADGTDGPIRRVAEPDMAQDTRDGAWRPAEQVPAEQHRYVPGPEDLERMLDAGEAPPSHVAPPALAEELRRGHPPLAERGLTVFFTGLSGSGKSTVARALYDALLERGDRSVTLLDGDVVRRLLSAGLTFSKADRDLNIRRIGYVAAEVARHGGLAICAPIAPYAATRAEVRRMVEEVGDFALVHVATPLEECERRDRKGLYAKARAGEIKEFTGISDPYEEPDDAELVLDTTDMSHHEAVQRVIDLLTERGWLRAR